MPGGSPTVPRGIRSNRLRKQGAKPASALGVKRNSASSKIEKTTSVYQEEFIKVAMKG